MQGNKKKLLVTVPTILVLSFLFVKVEAYADTKILNESTNVLSEDTNEQSIKTNQKDILQKNTNTNEDKSDINSKTILKDTEKKDNKNIENDKKLDDEVGKEILPQWKNIDGKLYYVTKEGILKKEGWFKQEEENPNANNDNEYYLDSNYAASIGWNKIDGLWYYFNENGVKQTGWHLINYNWYHLDKDGIMEKGWIKDDRNTYYLNDEGIMVSGKKYIDDKWYFFDNAGILQTKFYTYKGKSYYSDQYGVMVTNEWVNTKKNQYYVKADSSLAIGNIIIAGNACKFDSEGRYENPGNITEYLNVKYLNVGDADCAFIKLPNGQTVLIDTGDISTSTRVVNFLNQQELRKKDGKGIIDYIVISHAHSDHVGGLASVLENFNVGKIYLPDIAKMEDWFSNADLNKENLNSIKMLREEYRIYQDTLKTMNKYNKKFINTVKGEYIDEDHILQFVQSDKDVGKVGSEKILGNYWAMNENSAIVYLNYKDLQVLFTGDIQWLAEKDFWSNDLLKGQKIDVLKVAHHGLHTSSIQDFLIYLNPTIGVISRDEKSVINNEASTNLLKSGVTIYETSEKDGVSIYATEDGWNLEN